MNENCRLCGRDTSCDEFRGEGGTKDSPWYQCVSARTCAEKLMQERDEARELVDILRDRVVKLLESLVEARTASGDVRKALLSASEMAMQRARESRESAEQWQSRGHSDVSKFCMSEADEAEAISCILKERAAKL